ncbi:MAG: hypothetical protein WAT92_14500 [Saprospiraceae bacterium]
MRLTIVEFDERKKKKITSANVYSAFMTIGLLICFITIFFDLELEGFLAIILIICCFVPIFTTIYGWNEYYPVDFKIKGSISIRNNGIGINDEFYDYQQIKSLQFLINDCKGERLNTPGLFLDSGPSLSQGVNNKIEFEIKGEKKSLQVQLKSKEELLYLSDLIKELYLARIAFVEKLKNSKSYGLEHLQYKEIQAFKKKYIN